MTDKIQTLAMLIPDGSDGNVVIEHFTVSEDDAKSTMLRACIQRNLMEYVEAGEYIRLSINGEVMMSNTKMELDTNHRFIRCAKGRVLIGGLGIGMVIHAIKDKPEVTEIVVIEKNPSVIKLVAPHFKSQKLKVIEGDVFAWKPEKGEKFNTIYFDIWVGSCTDNLKDIAKLHQRFKSYKAKDGWMDSWEREKLKAKWNKEKKFMDFQRLLRDCKKEEEAGTE